MVGAPIKMSSRLWQVSLQWLNTDATRESKISPLILIPIGTLVGLMFPRCVLRVQRSCDRSLSFSCQYPLFMSVLIKYQALSILSMKVSIRGAGVVQVFAINVLR